MFGLVLNFTFFQPHVEQELRWHNHCLLHLKLLQIILNQRCNMIFMYAGKEMISTLDNMQFCIFKNSCQVLSKLNSALRIMIAPDQQDRNVKTCKLNAAKFSLVLYKPVRCCFKMFTIISTPVCTMKCF